MELLFPIVIVIAILELILSSIWSHFYFSVGIPIFKYEIPLNISGGNPKSDLDLEKLMPPSKYTPLKFNQLSKDTIAFRESAFGGFFKYSYTPVMHGNLKYTDRGMVRVTGLVNWFTVVFSLLFLLLPFSWRGDLPIIFIFPLFLAAMLAWIFYTQKKRYIEVARIASGKR